jgi:hypothetical protein
MPSTADRETPLSGAERVPPTPRLPSFVREPTATFWGALSAIRGKRIFHPDGVAYEAELAIDADGPDTGVPLFDVPGRHGRSCARRAAPGCPRACRTRWASASASATPTGPGAIRTSSSTCRPTCRCCTTSSSRRGTASSASRTPASCRTRIGERTMLVGAVPAAAERRRGKGALPELEELAALGEAAWDLVLARPGGRWGAPLGRLRLTARLSDRVAEGLKFNPWHTGGGIRPTGPLQGIRGAAYRGSQRGSGR